MYLSCYTISDHRGGASVPTFLVLKFLLPVRFRSGAGELLWGGLLSGACEQMASGSGGGAVSPPSGVSLAGGSTDSAGEPGGRSEQALMVLARRRC